MSDTLPFLTVDVFTDRPFLGNPVAVVLDADALDPEAMQRIARWTNLSETTFVLRPTAAGADYALRIFTPDRELPFAGHPTLGSARAVLETGLAAPRDGRLVQQCGAGLVPVRVDAASGLIAFEVPPARTATLGDADARALADALGLVGPPPRFDAIDVGPVWLTAMLADAGQVLALSPDQAALAAISRRLRVTGVTVHGAHPAGGPAATAVRSFAPAAGVPEDPVCGSGNACVALQRRASGLHVDYVAAQGEAIGRAGRIAVSYRGDAIEVGGATVVCVRGTLATHRGGCRAEAGTAPRPAPR
jgi:PhzF family phenazine biosynthesis protein